MNKELSNFIKAYSSNPQEVNRLVVSAFIRKNELSIQKNEFLKSFLISSADLDIKVLENFLKLINTLTFEQLIKLFEFVVSPQEKVVTGAVYTPSHIRQFIIEKAFEKVAFKKSILIGDIACGCGGFLMDVALKLHREQGLSFEEIFKKHLYGLDIASYSVERTKIVLSLLALSNGEDKKEFHFNLFTGNTLNFDWKKEARLKGFDLIVGNPPYVCSRNLEEESKQYLDRWAVCSSGHPDLYIPFFQIGMELLKKDGILGYITVNTFFKSINGRALRAYFQIKEMNTEIIDFRGEQIFDTKSTYTCICFIQNTLSSNLNYLTTSSDKLNKIKQKDFTIIPWKKLNAKKGWVLQSLDIVKKIEKTGTAFGVKYKARRGIATLKNNIYIFTPVGEHDEYYELQNGKKYDIEKGICKDIINPNKFIKTDDLNALTQKAIFPYYYDGNKPYLMEEDFLRKKFPKTYVYLTDKKKILQTRDKGKGQYANWYAYGRSQALEKNRYKLFFPHITPRTPNFVFSDNENLLFYNGIAAVSDTKEDLLVLEKIMSSKIFWFYVKATSKPYSSGYFSLSKNYIENFGIADLSKKEKEQLIKMNQEDADQFLSKKYDIHL